MNLPDPPFPTPPGVVYRSGRNRGICPRCHVFIVPTSRVVRLRQSEHPHATPDLRCSADTGQFYNWDHRPISLRPKWFVHERCYLMHYGMPSLPPEIDAALAASFSVLLEAEVAALAADIENSDAPEGVDIDALPSEMNSEDGE
jgi:hypothetical protein